MSALSSGNETDGAIALVLLESFILFLLVFFSKIPFMSAEYKTVADENLSNLDAEVNRLLGEGFELYGSPYSAGNEKESIFCQALVRQLSEPLSEVNVSTNTERMIKRLKTSVVDVGSLP